MDVQKKASITRKEKDFVYGPSVKIQVAICSSRCKGFGQTGLV